MGLLSGEDVLGFLENLTYDKTQLQKGGVDLTVKEIYVLESPGSLDFGGSELELGDRSKAVLEKRNSEDKYGWWNLSAGQYLLEFNERLSLPLGAVALVRPRTELLGNGSFHPVLVLTSDENLPLVPLSVGAVGLKIKQNARVSRLFVFEKE